MASSEPSITDHRSRLALTFDNLAGVLAKTGRKPEAEQDTPPCRRPTLGPDQRFPQLAPSLQQVGGGAERPGRASRGPRRPRGSPPASGAGHRQPCGRPWRSRRGTPTIARAAEPTPPSIETLIRSGEHADASKTVAEFVAIVPDSAPDPSAAARSSRGACRWRRPTRGSPPPVARTWPGATPTGRLSCCASR